MPILWRYALQGYLRVFSLSVTAFIAVLIVARFKEIARFTALSGEWAITGLFIVYQIPAILPIAIPVSALIASFFLFQRLSRTSELTALRSAGIGLRSLLAPILLCSLLLALAHFSICAAIAPYCRREGKTLIYQETSQNPLVLLKRRSLVKIKHAYLGMNVKDDETTKDLTLIIHNEANQRLNLLSARKLRIEGEKLIGGDLAIISYLPAEEGFDSLIIENQSSMSTFAPLLSVALKRNRPRIDANALEIKMLRIRAQEQGKKAGPARIEILRRLFLSFSVFSFTLLGCAFGIETGRNPSRQALYKALVLAMALLICYLLGKGLKNHFWLSIIAFLLPHPLVWLSSCLRLQRIAKGAA
jgi:lipopolysaccharide export system permease protein